MLKEVKDLLVSSRRKNILIISDVEINSMEENSYMQLDGGIKFSTRLVLQTN